MTTPTVPTPAPDKGQQLCDLMAGVELRLLREQAQRDAQERSA